MNLETLWIILFIIFAIALISSLVLLYQEEKRDRRLDVIFDQPVEEFTLRDLALADMRGKFGDEKGRYDRVVIIGWSLYDIHPKNEEHRDAGR